ncbi:hypothetical protein P4M26_27745 [Pseudomonas aeruginosa]|nr:hypothetical protein [Pseudomonas aeruginosa]
MQNYFGVFRTGSTYEGHRPAGRPARAYRNVKINDKSQAFNTARIEALKLQTFLEVAEATAIAAEHRKESRGAYAREDFESATTGAGCATPGTSRVEARIQAFRQLRAEDRSGIRTKVRTY